MDYKEALANIAEPINVEHKNTSYFSDIQIGLDPRLFRSNKLIPAVRSAILTALHGHLNKTYQDSELWTHAWLAGSGVSHQWAAARDPGDLDCLVGIEYEKFRESNIRYKGFSNQEIANTLNDGFRTELQPDTEEFLDAYELTFYVNVQTDILKIKPYAAYSVTEDEWAVTPKLEGAQHKKEWDVRVARDKSMALEIFNRYTQALNKIQAAPNAPARLNAQTEILLAASQGAALYDSIHHGRRVAFSESGEGYYDYANYRWQANKDSGIVEGLKKLKDWSASARKVHNEETYGVDFPDTDTLIRRAVLKNQ
jgi:hypothetical protein